MPICDPSKKQYKTIHTAHRTLMYLEKKLGRKMTMYECSGHWHVVVDKRYPSPKQVIRKFLDDARKTRPTDS